MKEILHKIKNGCHRIWNFAGTVFMKWKRFNAKNYANTNQSLSYFFIIPIALLLGISLCDFGIPKVYGFLVVSILGFLLVHFVIFFFTFLGKLVYKKSTKHIVLYALIIETVTVLFIAGALGVASIGGVSVLALLVGIIFIWWAKSVWALCKNRVYTKMIIGSVILSSLFIIVFAVFIMGDGFSDTYQEEYTSLNKVKEVCLLESEKPSYQVLTLEYGFEDTQSIPKAQVNLKPYIGTLKKWHNAYRKWQLGFDTEHVPIRGKVWYPKDAADCPVMFIAHGNHSFTEDSYLGYDYLGEYLAGFGYVVVSIDENVCNSDNLKGMSGENDARAVLLLEHIKQLETYNENASNPLYQKMDYENLAIAGHSRGGEMVADAILFNEYSTYPENGKYQFDYHYDIKSVIAISPTVNQYMPAEHEAVVQDKNYLLIHGANDQDVSEYQGSEQYKNVIFTGKGNYFKSSLYIAGANHGQFNTIWGKYDLPRPIDVFLNVKNLMPQETQQDIAKTYIKTFLDVTLKGNEENKKLLEHRQAYQEENAETVMIQGYQDSRFDCLADFEEDSDITTGKQTDIILKAENTSLWTERKTIYTNYFFGSKRNNHTLKLHWSNASKAKYEMLFPHKNVKESILQFDILNADNDAVKEKDYKAANIIMVCKDKNGQEASVSMKDYATVYPPLPVRISKFQFILKEAAYKQEFQTVRIPITEFEKANSKLDTKQITSVTFLFDQEKAGKIMLDNIGFS